MNDYQHVLELDSNRIDVHNRLAGIYWKQKHTDQATDEWKRVLELLKIQNTTSKTQETFWGDFSATVTNLATRKLLTQFQPDVNAILHAYVKRNGTYRLQPLLRSTLPRLESPSAATALLLELSADAPEKLSFLRQFTSGNADLKLDLEPIYHRVLELAQDKAQKSEGVAREYAQQEFEGLQVQWLQYLLKTKQYDRVRDELAALPKSIWERQQAALVPIQLKLAAQSNGLDAIVGGYRADAEHAPSSEVLRSTANELVQAGDKQAARKILEFVFAREIENRNLTAPNMLGLADIRIQAGDLEGGVSLLRRMTLVVGNPFETQDPAAALLVRTGHPAEAISFLQELVKAIPWNPDYRVRLAQAQIAANQNADAARKELTSVAASALVPYDSRMSAAKSLIGPGQNADLGSKELNLIAGGQAITTVDANQPFFFLARLKAAESLPAAARITLLRAALEDNPNGDTARVPLLKAATATGDYHLAIAAMKPNLQNSAVETALNAASSTDDDDDLASQESQADDTARTFIKLPVKERAEISRDLGLAFEKTNSLNQALPYLQRAYRLETEAAVKTQINKEVQQIRATLRRRTANLARQPVIHTDLEQEHVVRPRLAELAASSPPKPRIPVRKGASR